MKKTFLSISLLAALCIGNAHAQGINKSELSGALLLSGVYASVVLPSQAAGNAVKNVGAFLQDQSGLMVRSISNAGQHSVLAIGNASGALVASVTVAAGSVGAASMLVGQGVRVVVEASGHALYAGSQLIAFIPNELAKSLVYHEKIKG